MWGIRRPDPPVGQHLVLHRAHRIALTLSNGILVCVIGRRNGRKLEDRDLPQRQRELVRARVHVPVEGNEVPRDDVVTLELVPVVEDVATESLGPKASLRDDGLECRNGHLRPRLVYLHQQRDRDWRLFVLCLIVNIMDE